MEVEVKIRRNEHTTPVGKLADAEVHFTSGVLAGLKLVGFGVWTRRDGPGCHVTFPARQFTVHGERRSFALLRAVHDLGAQQQVRDLVLRAYDALAEHSKERTA
jgi:hypothetical protein